MKRMICTVMFMFYMLTSLYYNATGQVAGVSPANMPASADNAMIPFVGAQVFIEPGQTKEEIDRWFMLLRDNNFTVCRIRMFESYMKNSFGAWDFTLFDNAFAAAEKYGIRVFGTIFPYTDKTDIGGFKFPRDDAHLESIAGFIKEVVTHFNSYKSLYGWVLINEPGVGGKIPWTDYTKKRYEEWLDSHATKQFSSKGYPVLVDLDDQDFLFDLNTLYLSWLAGEIRKYDKTHALHVNNHAIFQNCAEYNFPEWRKFLTSLGGSAHAAWHFGYFTRQQYAVAMSANSEIVRSGAGNIQWFMTELQGGNNTYSGSSPMCPTADEIVQWLWIVTAAGGKGSIFWTLNPRSSGIEAGEWAMLDFQDNPSDRMLDAARVARSINRNAELFGNAEVAGSDINILYIRQSLWAESKMATGSAQNYEARKPGGVMKSSLGYFEALSEMGLNVNFKAFEEFDFGRQDYSGTTIILAHQISVPDSYASILEDFVSKGGKLIVDGLTAFFNEDLLNTMKTGFTFGKLFGGNVKEFRLTDNLFKIQWGDFSTSAHLWKGYLMPGTGTIAAMAEGEPVALRNRFGKGEVIWVPELLGLGARLSGDYAPLAKFLNKEAAQSLSHAVAKFHSLEKNMLMKTLKSGNSLITVIINKNERSGNVMLDFNGKNLTGTLLYSRNAKLEGYKLQISPEETVVIEWK